MTVCRTQRAGAERSSPAGQPPLSGRGQPDLPTGAPDRQHGFRRLYLSPRHHLARLHGGREGHGQSAVRRLGEYWVVSKDGA